MGSLDRGFRTLDFGPWTLDFPRSTLDFGLWAVDGGKGRHFPAQDFERLLKDRVGCLRGWLCPGGTNDNSPAFQRRAILNHPAGMMMFKSWWPWAGRRRWRIG